MIKQFIYIVVLILLLSVSSFAQGFDGASLGMGRAYGALARGIEAIAWNPANLSLSRNNFMELNLFAINLNIANSSFNVSNYNRYFTEEGHNGWWSEEDKQKLLNLVDDDGLQAYGDFNSNILGLAFGNFAFAVQGTGNMFFNFPKLPIELFLFGNTDKDKELRFKKVRGNGFGAVKITFASSFPISFKKYFNEFGVGVNLNYMQGFQYVEINQGRGFFNTSNADFKSRVTFKGRRADGGSGFSLDLGGSGIMNKKWTVSLFMQNVYSNFNWTNNPEAFLSSVSIDTGNVGDPESITVINQDTIYATDKFSKTLPLVIHIGSAYALGDYWVFSTDVEQAFGNEMGYSDKTLFSVGAQFDPIKILPLRTGITVGGKWGFLFGLGFGIRTGILEFDASYSIHRAMWPEFSRGNSFAFSAKIAI